STQYTLEEDTQLPTETQIGFCHLVYDGLHNNLVSTISYEALQHRGGVLVALQSLRQTGTVSAYMQEFNSHPCTVGWANTPLMNLYQHKLKERIELAVVMSNIQFTSLRTMQAMALKAGHKIEGIWNGQLAPIPTRTSDPTTYPNAMDLLAFQRIEPLLPLWPSQTCLTWILQQEKEMNLIANWGMYKGAEAEDHPPVGETGKSQRGLQDHNTSGTLVTFGNLAFSISNQITENSLQLTKFPKTHELNSISSAITHSGLEMTPNL
ncbi:uncharacterized protein VP01_4144g1, partial [Puccinia sorghi]